MAEIAPPPMRDRLAGRYCAQCPGCRPPRTRGPDCAGRAMPAALRRKAERRLLDRFVRAELGTVPAALLVDPVDCRHGCNGDCEQSGSDVCGFTCHAAWNEGTGDCGD